MLKYLTAILLLCFTANLAAQGSSPQPTLYYSETCGHCIKVLNFLRENPSNVTMKNIKNPSNYAELKSLGFRGVPVMVVGSDRMTGADQIISYLRAH